MSSHRYVAAALFLCGLILSPLPSLHAESLHLMFVDTSGKPVSDGVAVIRGPGLPVVTATEPVRITQRDKTFRPLVTVIHTGHAVEFPNEDDIMHHVYSFSKPKKFDIPLYKEKKPEPVVFDQPGVIVLGCNIHDWMKAYIYVTDAPLFGKSGETGKLSFSLPAGSYTLEVWHPRLKKVQGDPFPRQIVIGSGMSVEQQIVFDLKKESSPSRAPGLDATSGY